MSGTWTVQPLSLGQFDWAPGFEMFWMEPQAEARPLALVGLLLTGGDSHVLVNTGPAPFMLDEMNARWAGFDPRHQLSVRPDQQLEAALGAAGVTTDDIDHVIVTPFQPYAIGNLLELSRATYWLSRTGWIDFHAPSRRDHPHDHRPYVIPPHVLVPLVTDRWDQVALLDDEHQVAPGLSAFWVGSHHRSSMAVRVETSDGTVIASDCIFQYENIEEGRLLGINESIAETLASYDRIRAEADIVIPMYDERVFTRHPNGIGHVVAR